MDAHLEVRIIARVQAGQTAEFAHLVHRYQVALFRIVANLLEFKEADIKGRLDYIYWPAQSWSRFGPYRH